jgi:hypothetical protein
VCRMADRASWQSWFSSPRSRNVSCKNGEEEFQNLGIALTFVTMGIPHPMEQDISSPKHGAAAACSSGVPDRSNLRITAARPEITRSTSRFAPAATAASVGICEVRSVRNHRPRPPNGSYALPPQLPKRIAKVLMVLTSQDQLGNTDRKTGFCLEQLAAPYEVRCTRAVFARLGRNGGIPSDLRMRESTALIRFGRGNDAETVFDGPA